jgi:hypothetical protein
MLHLRQKRQIWVSLKKRDILQITEAGLNFPPNERISRFLFFKQTILTDGCRLSAKLVPTSAGGGV